MTEPKLKLVIAPGAFDDFEGTQEELDEMIAALKKMMEDGTLDENARLLSPKEEEEFFKQLNEKENPRQ